MNGSWGVMEAKIKHAWARVMRMVLPSLRIFLIIADCLESSDQKRNFAQHIKLEHNMYFLMRRRFIAGIAFSLVLPVFFSCETKKVEQDIAVSSVSVLPETIEMEIGETKKLNATILPSNATDKSIRWTSANPSVATVSQEGDVSAVSDGTSSITASCGGKTGTCSVTVKKGVIDVSGIQLDKNEVSLYEGESLTLIATVSPADATDKTVTWSSSDNSIATVDGGNITAKKEGTVQIKAIAGSATAECKVVVSKLIKVESLSLNQTDVKLAINERIHLVATISPDNALYIGLNWATSDSSIAGVDNEGYVTAQKKGSAVITVTPICSYTTDVKTTCSIQVYVPVESVQLDKSTVSIKKNQQIQLTVTVMPETADYDIIQWKSSDENVVTVSETGLVTGVGNGEATITVTVAGKTATCSFVCKVDEDGTNEGTTVETW